MDTALVLRNTLSSSPTFPSPIPPYPPNMDHQHHPASEPTPLNGEGDLCGSLWRHPVRRKVRFPQPPLLVLLHRPRWVKGLGMCCTGVVSGWGSEDSERSKGSCLGEARVYSQEYVPDKHLCRPSSYAQADSQERPPAAHTKAIHAPFQDKLQLQGKSCYFNYFFLQRLYAAITIIVF